MNSTEHGTQSYRVGEHRQKALAMLAFTTQAGPSDSRDIGL